MRGYYEFSFSMDAVKRQMQITRLGWSTSSIFQTAQGKWAFYVN